MDLCNSITEKIFVLAEILSGSLAAGLSFEGRFIRERRALLASEKHSKSTCLICVIDSNEKGLDKLVKKQTHGLLGS